MRPLAFTRLAVLVAAAGLACQAQSAAPPVSPGPSPSASPAKASPRARGASPSPSPSTASSPAASSCGTSPGDWCPAPAGDPCGAHKDVAGCRADSACVGMPYRGESYVACQVDPRGFATNCPTVGCVSRSR